VSASSEAGATAGLSPQFHTAHHFDSADQQFESNRMGVWLFLVTEILFFGGLFCGFAVFRAWYFPAFLEAHHKLDWHLGAANTIVLITSSLTMALAVRGAQTNSRKVTSVLLVLTLLCAATFMVIKGFEYHHKWVEGFLPGKYFHPKEPFASGKDAGVFFALYFMMTGVHGLHVLIGMGLITWILIRNQKGHFSQRYYSPVENVGLYWHLVDMVWIYLFPLLYLVS
jgi:cytochrome c oxidase subunit 3